jgi:hypothetical protein
MQAQRHSSECDTCGLAGRAENRSRRWLNAPEGVAADVEVHCRVAVSSRSTCRASSAVVACPHPWLVRHQDPHPPVAGQWDVGDEVVERRRRAPVPRSHVRGAHARALRHCREGTTGSTYHHHHHHLHHQCMHTCCRMHFGHRVVRRSDTVQQCAMCCDAQLWILFTIFSCSQHAMARGVEGRGCCNTHCACACMLAYGNFATFT